MAAAAQAFRKIMGARPDFGKGEPPEYAVGLTEALAHLSPQELAWVLDPREGINARCKFLPTVADVMALVRDRQEKQDQFRSRGTSGYKLLRDEPGPWDEETPDRRKAAVSKLWPKEEVRPTRRQDLVPPSTDDLEGLKTGTKLKPPSKSDATPQLKKLLRMQEEEGS